MMKRRLRMDVGEVGALIENWLVRPRTLNPERWIAKKKMAYLQNPPPQRCSLHPIRRHYLSITALKILGA
jgi:hypothetical protein